MAIIYPDIENIQRLKVRPTEGEIYLINYLKEHLDDTYEVFFNPYLDGDRPDIILMKEDCALFIIEIKDWNLSNYSINENNKWIVKSPRGDVKILSPHSQAFRYKKNLYDLHLPVIGLKRLENKNFYNLVHCFVYFHCASKLSINYLYKSAEDKQYVISKNINEDFQSKKINFNLYERIRITIDLSSKRLQRDKSISIGNDQLETLVKKIKSKAHHVLFDKKVYDDFKRRFTPPLHVEKQGLPINFDDKQLALTKSNSEKIKIKGVAGCGKTSILCQRAINSVNRHNSTVLILTFNITLKNYIRDKISDMQGGRNFDSFEITNYHQFYNSQLNNTGKNIEHLIDTYGLSDLYSVDVFDRGETIKYKSIFIDEIQDYQSEWVKIIRDKFLEEEGEMVLFGEESQNIYETDFLKSPIIAQGFGRWIKLKRSYRTNFDSPLNKLFHSFQINFLIKNHADSEIIDLNTAQMGISFGIMEYCHVPNIDSNIDIFLKIKEIININNINPNDVVIISSKIYQLRIINELFESDEKTSCMFESYSNLSVLLFTKIEDLKKLDENSLNEIINKNKEEIDRIRRVKKNHFYANSGLIKLSTIYSYKGLESKIVFYLMEEDDTPELIYTAITRASESIVVFDLSGKNIASDFFKKEMSLNFNISG